MKTKKRKRCNKHGYYHSDICPGCLGDAAPDLLDKLKTLNAAYQDSLTAGTGCACSGCYDASKAATIAIANVEA